MIGQDGKNDSNSFMMHLVCQPRVNSVKLVHYCLGEDADNVLVLANITEDECKRYKNIVAKFDGHFIIRHNLIFEQAKFNTSRRKC